MSLELEAVFFAGFSRSSLCNTAIFCTDKLLTASTVTLFSLLLVQEVETVDPLRMYARGYEDYLQVPLQPLMDNLGNILCSPRSDSCDSKGSASRAIQCQSK